jgi:hypothetical protein
MTDFLIGCGSSILATFLVWLLVKKFIPELRRRYFRQIPTVQGTYEMVKMSSKNPDEPDSNADAKTVVIRQTGAKVSGIVFHPPDRKCSLNGFITGSRLLTFSWEPQNSNIHDYGTAVMKLTFDGTEFYGVATFLCACCEDITPARVVMRKKIDAHDA